MKKILCRVLIILAVALVLFLAELIRELVGIDREWSRFHEE